jgi:hypothetical protein
MMRLLHNVHENNTYRANHVCLSVLPFVCRSAWFNSRTTLRIWIKFGMDIMPLECRLLKRTSLGHGCLDYITNMLDFLTMVILGTILPLTTIIALVIIIATHNTVTIVTIFHFVIVVTSVSLVTIVALVFMITFVRKTSKVWGTLLELKWRKWGKCQKPKAEYSYMCRESAPHLERVVRGRMRRILPRFTLGLSNCTSLTASLWETNLDHMGTHYVPDT